MADLFDTRPNDVIAIERFQTFVPPEGFHLAFSGGKDSVVILDLARRSGVRFDSHYVNTGIELPDMISFTREHYPEVNIDRPRYSFFQEVRKHGLPTRHIRWCCDLLKERSATKRFVVTGVRRAESRSRASRPMVQLCARRTARLMHPIIDWSDHDVWHYIRTHALPVPDYYRQGLKRLGCVACPMTSTERRERELELAPKLKRAYQLAADAYIHSGKDNWITQHMTTGDEYFRFWLDGHGRHDDDSPGLFD